ncbi:HU family DNA-binding protein [Mediterranea massiliensis]|uniref:HU family DNA-binding protein n=1 Tax=Mediterranea massiliensis TaxID=1841865 RepID=UPI0025A3D158|nr:HU family DNA-binding protein [Mediterranea massiliensis]MDM8336735.1 DNA-binding protein [Mediterranea massiliensis]
MFFKKSKLKVNGKTKWFPRAVIVSKRPADSDELARRIAQMSTASTGDVHLVLRSLPSVMAQIMNEGRTVHIDGLGSFFFKLSCAGRGVDTPEEVSRKQIKDIRVQFLPERQRIDGKRFGKPLTQDVELEDWDVVTGAANDDGQTASK